MKKHFFLTFFFVVFYSYSQQMMYGPQRGQRGYIPPPRANTSPYISNLDTYEELEKVLPKCVEIFSLDDFEREILKGMLIKKYDSYNKIVENTDMSKQARQEGLRNLEIEFIKSLAVILSPDEITTYVDTDFSDKNQKKKKKRRKRRKNKE